MSDLIRLFTVFLFALLTGFCSYGQGNAPKYSNEFLSLGVGARGLGMSGAQVANVSDVTAGYWNPSGLLSLRSDHQLSLMHTSYFAGIANYDFGGFAMKMDDSTAIGLTLIRFSVDDIPDTRFLYDANGVLNYGNIRFFSAADYAAMFSYARRLPILGGLDMGANVKIIHRLVGDFSKAWGFGLDIGFQKNVGKWQFGLSGRDVFGTFNTWAHDASQLEESFLLTGNDVPVSTTEITLPRWIVGVAYPVQIASQLDLLLSADLQTTFDGKRNALLRSGLLSVDPMAGMELSYKNTFFLRYGAGQFQQVESLQGEDYWSLQMTGGVGFKLKELTVDYALTDIGDVAVGLYSHVFTITVDFYAKGD